MLTVDPSSETHRAVKKCQGGLVQLQSRYEYLSEPRPPWMDLGAIPFSLNIFVKMLQSIVERGKEAHAGYAQKRKAYRLGTFGRLIGSLKFVFETEGAIATAAKSSRAKSPKPSAFVLFVWSLMQTLPESIREHVHSMPAMEEPISTKLKYWRRSGMQSGRTDCLLSQNGCGGRPMTGMYSDVTVTKIC